MYSVCLNVTQYQYQSLTMELKANLWSTRAQSLSQPPSITSFCKYHSSSYIHGAAISRCFSRSGSRSLLIGYSILSQEPISNTTDPDREDCPEILPRPARRKGRQVRGLCYALSSSLHDTRQFVACSIEIHVNWSQQDPRQ